MHPIMVVQEALVTALKADAALAGIVGDGVFDAPPTGRAAPYVVIARHDVIQRDGDIAVLQEHRVVVHCWGSRAGGVPWRLLSGWWRWGWGSVG